jgi:hypothetical protein
MPVQFVCEHCGKTLRVRDDLAGKKVKCPHCQGVVRVPAQAPVEKWYLQTEDGETYGPVVRSELDRWSQEGRITADCQVLREGTDQWQWATDLYPQLATETASVPPAELPAPKPQQPQISQKAPSPASAPSTKSVSPVETARPAASAASASPSRSPAKSAPGSGSGFDFAGLEQTAAPAKQPGPFDFAPSAPAPATPSGPLDFGAGGGSGRGRTAAKKGKTGAKAKASPAAKSGSGESAPKSKVVALLLAFFLGTLGVHRFYLGYTMLGVLMLVTAGGCGIWALVDFILIAIDKVTDAQGRPLS